jgi:ADP-ribose diphosphatase
MSDQHASVEESRGVYSGRIFDVTVDRVAYPDGRRVTMEVVRHPGSVVLLPLPSSNHIILVRQYRYVVDKWLWELPAGTVDPGEDLERAALRECHEEIGRIADRVRKLASFYPSPGFCDERMNFFLLSELRDRRPDEAAAAQDPDELLTVKEFSISEARGMVARGEIVDMKTALGLSLLPAML